MIKRFLDHDPGTGITRWHYYDELTGKSRVESIQDVEPILNKNKALFNDERNRAMGMKKDWVHVASIPITVQHKWLREHGIDINKKDHWPAIKRLLNSPEYRYLKTANMKI